MCTFGINNIFNIFCYSKMKVCFLSVYAYVIKCNLNLSEKKLMYLIPFKQIHCVLNSHVQF